MMSDMEKAAFMEITNLLKKDAQAFADLAEQCKNKIENIKSVVERVSEMLK